MLGLAAWLVATGAVGGQAMADLSREENWPVCTTSRVARIGAMEGRTEMLFDGISDAVFIPGGALAVLNRNSQEVRLFRADGTFLLALGRRGEGPGELKDPIEVALLGPDSIAVWDWALGRVTVFPLRGGSVRTVRLNPVAPNPTGHFGVTPGLFLVGSQDHKGVGQPHGGGGEQWLNVLAYDMSGQLRDTVARLPYGRYVWVDESRREAGYPHFEARGTFSVRGGRLVTASGSDPSVRVEEARPGSGSREVKWTPPDRRITPRDVAAKREYDFGRFTQPALQQRIRRNWEVLPVAERFPALQEVLADEVGRLWVKRYPPVPHATQVWWSFDLGGAFRCALKVEDGFSPLEFEGEMVVGRIRDEFDVEYVEVRRIQVPRR